MDADSEQTNYSGWAVGRQLDGLVLVRGLLLVHRQWLVAGSGRQATEAVSAACLLLRWLGARMF